jgi:NAD(P)-dependent dehydrogenase (short-subunit alcohol dehydrogenase family)
MKSVVITGVSTGIGHASAAALLSRGYRVFGSVRSEDDAERLRAELGDDFCPLVFDVRDEAAIARAAEVVALETKDAGLHALINNSGISLPGPLAHQELATIRAHFDVNVTGLLAVTQAFLPALGARRNCPHPPGRIVNIGSVAGRIAYPFMGAYAASKYALEGLSDVLRRELAWYGVHVVLIEPSTIKTPIIDKFDAQLARYANTDYASVLTAVARTVESRRGSALPLEAVTRVVIRALESGKPKTRYPIPRNWLFSWALPRWLPDRWFDGLVAKRLGLVPERLKAD